MRAALGGCTLDMVYPHLFVRITMMIVITDDIVTSKNYTAYDFGYDNDYSRKY